MTSPRDLKIEDYTYLLPDERIARFPMEDRDQSKMLVYDGLNQPETAKFAALASYLPENCLLVLNNTRVIHARLLFQKETGAHIELFCLNPVEPVREMQQAFAQTSGIVWECMIGNAKRWKGGRLRKELSWNGLRVVLFVERYGDWATERLGDDLIKFSWEPATIPFAEIVEHFGKIPLPPYLKREAEEKDEVAYQTVYAIHDGSVAAPTAGLHFTEEVFKSLAKKGIMTDYVTLHVGAGTFRPVSTSRVGDHAMHPEPFIANRALIEELRQKKYATCFAVGTTSVRSLESLYWFGVKLIQDLEQPFYLDQWEVYDKLKGLVSLEQSMDALLIYMDSHQLSAIKGVTRIIIAPSYEFHVIDGIITNFHQPASTLLLLVSAFLGDSWKIAYEYALLNDFRFLSFGDSCLFMNKRQASSKTA